MRRLIDHDVASLEADLRSAGHPPSHARRVLREFYAARGSPRWDPVVLGKALTARLERNQPPRPSRLAARTVAADGTTKLLLGFERGGAVESVLMPSHRPGRTMGCVSSQIGCAMGCDFCASTKRGLERNLEAGEIVEQYLRLCDEASGLGRKLTTLVFMGMGEPMHNLDNVLPAIRRIADPRLGGLGWRQVTVSTVGVVPGIRRLADEDLNVHLAVSLHTPDDETRSRLVPANRRWPVAEIVDAAREFQERTGRIVTIEYCLLAGVNDCDEHAAALAALLEGFRAHVNLIPYNTIGEGVSGTVYLRPSRDRMIRFLGTLRDAGTVAHFRDTRGDDVNAACGQLRETVLSAPVPSPGTPGEG